MKSPVHNKTGTNNTQERNKNNKQITWNNKLGTRNWNRYEEKIRNIPSETKTETYIVQIVHFGEQGI